MSSMWRKAMVQLGLGDDDEYDDYDDQPVRRAPAPPPEEPRAVQPRPAPARPAAQPRSVQPVPNRSASVSALPTQPDQGGSVRFPTHGGPPEQPTVQPVPVGTRDERVRAAPATPSVSGVRTIPRPNAKPHVVAPRSFGDAQEVGDTFKAKQPVIINLQGVDRDLSRRLVDFTSGLCYGIGGQMEKVATDVFLLTPVDVEVSPEERQRLQERGLYDT